MVSGTKRYRKRPQSPNYYCTALQVSSTKRYLLTHLFVGVVYARQRYSVKIRHVDVNADWRVVEHLPAEIMTHVDKALKNCNRFGVITMDFFRGYIELNGKTAKQGFKKGTPLKSLSDVQDCESYAGILADDAVLIDIDDYEQSETLMQIVEDKQLLCRVYETSRGKHFFFKNSKVEKCANHVRLACGLTADIKSGKKNSYAVRKKGRQGTRNNI